MVTVDFDGKQLEVPADSTVVEAARLAGVEIPTLCYRGDCTPQNACLVCVVKVDGRERLQPGCSTKVYEQMRIESESDDVRLARRTAIELLLSDHAGSCVAPCQTICPAHMDIPLMMRQIAAGQMGEALVTVKKDIALPAVLGRVCPAPCEGGCRRKPADGPVSVCLLKRYVADIDIESGNQYLPECAADNGKKVAVVGAGAAGLSGAYYLRQMGYGVTVYDARDVAGGELRASIPRQVMPEEILDAEIEVIKRLGVVFEFGKRLGVDIQMQTMRDEYDAVLLATGVGDGEGLGVAMGNRGVVVDEVTMQTSNSKVFAAGAVIRKTQLAVRSVAEGKNAAVCIDQFLQGEVIVGQTETFSVALGRLDEEELAEFMLRGSEDKRLTPEGGLGRGYTAGEAARESVRCLRCDCNCSGDCRLQRYAREYGAHSNRYRGTRRRFEMRKRQGGVLYEPGKCIACGLCIDITERKTQGTGVTYVGRGFEIKVEVPFEGSFEQGLGEVAAECVTACPTGALTFVDGVKSSRDFVGLGDVGISRKP